MAEENEEAKKPAKKKKSKIIPIILIIVLIGGAIFGFYEYRFYQDFSTTDDAQVDGNINPVIARVSGYVDKIYFSDNQYVHAGDTLVVLDDRDYLVRLEQAKAGLSISNAQIDVSKSNVTTTGADVAPAQARVSAAQAALWEANQNYERYKNLIEQKAITESQFDAIKTQRATAQANLVAAQKTVDAIQQQVHSTQQVVSATKSNIGAQQANIDFAKLQLSYTVITAPVSGVVSKRNIQIGQLVSPGQSLFAIVDIDSIYVTANYKETDMDKIRIGQPVSIQVDAYPDLKIKGFVQSFSGATGAKFSLLPPDNATGNFVKVVQRIPIKIEFDSLTTDLKSKLRPGMSVFSTIDIKSKK